MRSIGTGVLAVLATLAAIALLGATPASATTFCKAKEEVCAKGNRYPAGTIVKIKLANETTSEFKTSLGTILCGGATGEGESTEESTGSSSVALPILLGNGFNSCKLGKTACTVIPPNPVLILSLFLWAFPPFHTEVEPDPIVGGKASIAIKCGVLINCSYNLEGLLFAGENGTPASLSASEALLASEGGFCPETTKWTVKYEVTEPNPLWVAAEP